MSTILDRGVFVDTKIKIWSAEVVLSKSDIKLGAGGELPPNKLASLGTKRLIAREPLAPLHKIRGQSDRLLEASSIGMIKSRMVLREDADALKTEVEALKQAFTDIRDNVLVPNVTRLQSEWRDQFPDYAAELAEREMTPDQVRGRCSFNYTIYEIKPAAGFQDSLGERVKSLDEDLLADVAGVAETMLDYIVKQGTLTRKFANPLKRLRLKLAKFAFFNEPMIQPIVDAMDVVIDKITRAKGMTPFLQSEILALVQLLSDPDRMRTQGAALVTIATFSSNSIVATTPPSDLLLQIDSGIVGARALPTTMPVLEENVLLDVGNKDVSDEGDLLLDPGFDDDESDGFFAPLSASEIAAAQVEDECLGF